jgi:hypothetical protein
MQHVTRHQNGNIPCITVYKWYQSTILVLENVCHNLNAEHMSTYKIQKK